MKSVKVQSPKVEVESAKLTQLSFSGLDLLFNLKISNPNQFGLKLSGFSYELFINDSSFVAGDQTEGLEIAAQDESIVQLPLTIQYNRLFETFRSLIKEDRTSYELRCVFSFDVPVLGDMSVPVKKEGEFPVLRFPEIRFDALRIVRLGLTTATLELNIFLSNPNPIGLFVKDLVYSLSINGDVWASGSEIKTSVIPSNGRGLLSVPIDIRVLDVGRFAFSLVEKEESARFQLIGAVGFSTTLPVMGHTDLPFELSGNLRIRK
jgi:LEA14-like dessication related protein